MRYLSEFAYRLIEQSRRIYADFLQILVILRVDSYLERFSYSMDNARFLFFSLFHVSFLLCPHVLLWGHTFGYPNALLGP